LDMTRISRGKIALQRTLFDLGELVRKTADDYASLFATKEVNLHIDIPAKHVDFEGDSTRIAQVVGNLLQNAAKFTLSGGSVWLSLHTDEADGVAVIRIRDTGIGFTPEVRSRLFQPFEQAAATLDRSSGGLGLGLALVKALVEMHGGNVEARSQGLGTGAEFSVHLPIQAKRATEAARPNEAVRSPSRRVLIIEDNVDSASSLRDVLRLGGHTVEVAHSGLDGLDKARQFIPDIVFCDIGLPETDGYKVARAFRDDEHLRSAYMIALTGYALPDDRSKAIAAGFDEHVAKPPNLANLRETLAKASAGR
jgi:two-component system CheB/CheR fusion protein